MQLEDARVFQLDIKRGIYTSLKDSIPQANMRWIKNDVNCDAIFETEHTTLCFKNSGRPEKLVLIKRESEPWPIGNIADIKKFRSVLTIMDGKELIMRPVGGVLTVLDEEKPIARVFYQKRKHHIEIDALYAEDDVLKAAILYKHFEYTRMKNNSNDDILMFLLLFTAF